MFSINQSKYHKWKDQQQNLNDVLVICGLYYLKPKTNVPHLSVPCNRTYRISPSSNFYRDREYRKSIFSLIKISNLQRKLYLMISKRLSRTIKRYLCQSWPLNASRALKTFKCVWINIQLFLYSEFKIHLFHCWRRWEMAWARYQKEISKLKR